MKSDVRRGSGMLKQNLKTIRGWLEEEGSQASKYISCPDWTLHNSVPEVAMTMLDVAGPAHKRSKEFHSKPSHPLLLRMRNDTSY